MEEETARLGFREGVASNRKVFNVITDASSLISGVKRNTRDGIKKWVNNGAIRLFVPLHTLQQLNHLSTTRTDRFGTDAKETLVWLDQITSEPHVLKSGLVQLQESYEAYETWAEVQHFLLPKTLLSHESGTSDDGDVHASLDKLRIDDSLELVSASSKDSPELRPMTPGSPDSTFSATSPSLLQSSSPYKRSTSVERPLGTARRHKKNDSLAASDISVATNGDEPRIPKSLQPLFNHILWRIHHTQVVDAEQGLGAYILLTSDHLKQSIARRFGIRVKHIEQLRDIIAREDRELRNRLDVLKRENENAAFGADSYSRDEDAILQRPISRGSPQRNPQQQRVWDPNTFGRAGNVEGTSTTKDQPGSHTTPTGPADLASARGRGGRGNRGLGRGLHMVPHAPRQLRGIPQQDVQKPIDPDSFDRPRPGRGRGGGRRHIWNPS